MASVLLAGTALAIPVETTASSVATAQETPLETEAERPAVASNTRTTATVSLVW